MGFGAFDSLPVILGELLLIYWAIILVVLINDGRDPTKTLAWLLVLWLFPGLGLVFYYFLGRNWKKKTAKGKWIHEVRRLGSPTVDRYRETYAKDAEDGRAWALERDYEHLVGLIETADGSQPMAAYDVDLMHSGEEKFDKLVADLSQAKDTINIQYFIWERDDLTARICAVLLERLQAGVEVRMLNDFIGNIQYKKDQLKTLSQAGARIKYDVTDLGKINYRNHRKMVVIDAVLGYTGGINVGQEYIDGGPRYPSWRDTHVRFHGPAVADLQRLFAARWHEATDENLFTERFFPLEYPTHGRRSLAHVVATGVEDKWESARRAHVVAMGLADERIWIQSPYFVPDDAVYEAMINAALSGIDVRLMMTGLPDKKIAWYAAQSYFQPFIEAGGRVFYYEAGFLHAKTMLIDSELYTVGTLNLDIRSLELHKELMVWFYDSELAAQHIEAFEHDLEGCREVTIADIDALTPLQIFRDSAARLTSNLL